MDKNKATVFVETQTETGERELVDINLICRLCANQNEKLIGIYSEDGNNNELATKMNLYLPIKVDQSDSLPLQCCLTCTSTLLAWHDLVMASVEADQRLRNVTFFTLSQYSTGKDAEQKEGERLSDSMLDTPIRNEEPNQNVPPDHTDTPLYPENLDISEFHKNAVIETPTQEETHLDNIYEDGVISTEEKDPEPPSCFGCPICQMVFKTQEEMYTHNTSVHADVKIKEEGSEEKPDTKKVKKKHTKIDQQLITSAKLVVDGKEYYHCKVCGRCLYSPYTYVWHTRIHTGERPHKCETCGKRFRVSQGLMRHLRETHQGIKKFSCDLCGRSFASRRNVDEHRRIHTNERPYVCDLCGKSFKQKASLFVHGRSHSNNFPFKCAYCDQLFRTRPPLLIHITKHTGEKPYPCDVCGRHFRIKYELKKHKLIHSDEKPFGCDMCDLKFKQKRYLRNHKKAHNFG